MDKDKSKCYSFFTHIIQELFRFLRFPPFTYNIFMRKTRIFHVLNISFERFVNLEGRQNTKLLQK